MAPPNPTGFDMKKFVNAASSSSEYAKRDPWARAERWRYTGPFSRFNRFKGAFPGLGIATVAFTAYCAYEWAFLSNNAHGHADGDSRGGEKH